MDSLEFENGGKTWKKSGKIQKILNQVESFYIILIYLDSFETVHIQIMWRYLDSFDTIQKIFEPSGQIWVSLSHESFGTV